MPMALHGHVFNHSTILSLAICLFCSNLFALNGDLGGASQDGSADHPWLIQDLLDFHEFTGDSNYWDDHTRLECDPDLAGITYTTAVIAPDISSSQGYQGTPFTGTFDGNGHIISNLTIDDAGAGNDYLGLFGPINGTSSEVKNLGLEYVNIYCGNYSLDKSSIYVGGLCGYNIDCYINNCYAVG